jgi:diacylglycerol kinase family enzyme
MLAPPDIMCLPPELPTRALLIINRTAGTGQDQSLTEKLTSIFKQGLHELSQVQVELVSSHAAVRACAARFMRDSDAPALIVAGGGGGTLRAVIEGICETCAMKRVCVAALRLGSGNVLAKQFGVPRDPITGIERLLVNLKARRTTPCCVMRCQTWTRSGDPEVHHAVTLGGLGQFGRIPSDLARWHARLPLIHKGAAKFGIEKFTNVEYAFALFIRSLSCMLFPDRAETVEIQFQNQKERFQLFSGLVMNFPFGALPFKPDITVADESLMVYLIPRLGRRSSLWQAVAPKRLIFHTRSIKIEKNQTLEIRFVDRECVEFFLDEDPVTTYGRLSLQVAGSIAFVHGAESQHFPESEISK